MQKTEYIRMLKKLEAYLANHTDIPEISRSLFISYYEEVNYKLQRHLSNIVALRDNDIMQFVIQYCRYEIDRLTVLGNPYSKFTEQEAMNACKKYRLLWRLLSSMKTPIYRINF